MQMIDKGPSTSGDQPASPAGGAAASLLSGNGVNELSLAIHPPLLFVSAGIAFYALFIRPETRINWPKLHTSK